jgi:5-methylthioribose kinase
MSGDLDIERPGELEAYLRAGGRIGRDESVCVRRLSGGVSNRVMLVEFGSGRKGGWVVKQALPKLRVAVDWFSDPARIGREALGLRVLGEMLPAGAVPRLIFLDEERHVLAMSAVAEPHENWKAMLMRGEVDLGLVSEWGRMLGSIHREGALRRPQLFIVFENRSFFESLRVEAYYEYTAGQVDEARSFYESLIRLMRQRRDSLVHGDYSPKNVLVHEGRLVLLDHEVIHFGDPSFDVGFALTHLLSKAHHLAAHRDRFGAAAARFYEAYAEGMGLFDLGAPGLDVSHTLGCLLARVAGRSPLEYLTAAQKQKQREIVLDLMGHRPSNVWALVDAFLKRI